MRERATSRLSRGELCEYVCAMKRVPKVLLFVVLVGLVCFGVFFLVSINPVTVSDSNLRVTRAIVSDESNAFPLLQAAAAESWWPEDQQAELDDLARGTNWNAALATTALANNQKALAMLDAALARPEFQLPEFRWDDDVSYLGEWKKLSRVAAIRANALFRAGQEQEAFNLAMNLVRMGNRIQASQGNLLHYLVGLAVKAQALAEMRRWATLTCLDPQQLTIIAEELRTLRSDGAALAETLKLEYQGQMQTLADMRAGKLKDPDTEVPIPKVPFLPIYSTSQSRRLFATTTRALVSSINVPYNKAKLPDLDQKQGIVRLILRGNLVGEMFHGTTMPSVVSVIGKKSQESVQLEATRITLALRAYQLKNGRLPEDLSALVPEFLKEVPLDDFDGQPMRYSREPKRVYSVSTDSKDDGGVETDTRKHTPDYAFPFSF